MIFNIADLREEVNKLFTDIYGRGTAITAGDDLDDYYTPGVYYSPDAATSATITNTPYTAGNFKVVYIPTGGTNSDALSDYGIQVLIVPSTAGRWLYIRSRHNGAWRSWLRIANENDVAGVYSGFSERSVNYSYTLAANGTDATNLKTLIDADVPTGYKFLSISGFTSNNSNAYIYTARYYNNNYSLALKNTSDSALTGEAVIYYLCSKE